MQLETFFSVSQHTSLFLLSVVLGAVLGVVYDAFRAIRIIFPPAAKNGAVIVEDIIFCIICGFSIFCFSSLAARGQIRFFIILGTALGFILYILTIGFLITSILKLVFSTVYSVLRKVYSLAIEPVVNFSRKICQKAVLVFVGSNENVKNKKVSEKNT